LECRDSPAIHQEAYAIRKQSGNNSPADVGELRRDRFREDAQVQKNNGDLRHHDDELVDVLIEIKVLQHQRDVVEFDRPDVTAQARKSHYGQI
jgi:hypothetical protein